MNKPPDPEVASALQDERTHDHIKHTETLNNVKLKYEPCRPHTKRVKGTRTFLVSSDTIKRNARPAVYRHLHAQLVRLARCCRGWIKPRKEVR